LNVFISGANEKVGIKIYSLLKIHEELLYEDNFMCWF